MLSYHREALWPNPTQWNYWLSENIVIIKQCFSVGLSLRQLEFCTRASGSIGVVCRFTLSKSIGRSIIFQRYTGCTIFQYCHKDNYTIYITWAIFFMLLIFKNCEYVILQQLCRPHVSICVASCGSVLPISRTHWNNYHNFKQFEPFPLSIAG